MMTATTNKTVNEMAAFADAKSLEFKGADGFSPAVECFDGPRGKGFHVSYDDEPTGLLIGIKFHNGFSAMNIQVLGKDLDHHDAARVAKVIAIAAEFAAALEAESRR